MILLLVVNADKLKDKSKQYRTDNREKLNVKSSQYRVDNKEKIKQYRENNKEKMKQKMRGKGRKRCIWAWYTPFKSDRNLPRDNTLTQQNQKSSNIFYLF